MFPVSFRYYTLGCFTSHSFYQKKPCTQNTFNQPQKIDPRGFAFVIFHDAASVDNVMADQNKNKFHERMVDVKRFQATVAPRGPSHPDPDRLAPLPSSSSSSYRHASSSTTPRNGGGEQEYCDFRIFVGGLASDVDRHELRRVFEGFGSVLDATVMVDPNTTRSRGFGFVTYDRTTGPKAVDRILRISSVQVRGKNVEVRRAHPPTEPGGGSSSGGGGSFREVDRYPPQDMYDVRDVSVRRDSSGRGDYMSPSQAISQHSVGAVLEANQCELFVGSLPFDVDRLELKRIFDLFGTVVDAIVVIDPITQRSRGFGFVTFDTSDGLNAIDRVLRAAPLQVRGRNIEVKRAKPPIDSGASSSSQQRSVGMGNDSGRGRDESRGRDASPVQGGLYPHKIFVGGLPPDVDRMELRRLFQRYGEVLDTIVMIDPATHRSRCFGFVSFDRDYGAEAVERVIRAQPIQIGGRSVEIRRARPPTEADGGVGGGVAQRDSTLVESRLPHRAVDDYDDYRGSHEEIPRRLIPDAAPPPMENQGLYKIFVGGLAPEIDRDELRRVFERYGEVMDAVVMVDPDTQRSRGFGFVTFDDMDGKKATDHIMQIQPIQIHGRTVEVKLASPLPPSIEPKDREPVSINEDRIRTELPPEQSQYRVFVGGLPPEVDKAELKQIFERFGLVIDSVVMIDAATHRSRGFGFVTFDEVNGPESIERALQAQPLQVHGRSVEIRRGRPPTAPGEGRGAKRNVDSDNRGGTEYRPARSNDYDDVRPLSSDYDRRYDDDDERYKRSRY
jgi:RNA-binding protein Musashi